MKSSLNIMKIFFLLIYLFAHQWCIASISPQVEKFLNEPAQTFENQKIPKGFRIITLNHIAHYLCNEKRNGAIDNTAYITWMKKLLKCCFMQGVRYQSKSSMEAGNFQENGLYLSHLNIILGVYKSSTGSNEYQNLNEKISHYINKKSLLNPSLHIASYSGSKFRFPADQSASLYSLYLFDQNYETDLSDEPIKKWILEMQQHQTIEKLPYSEITKGTSYSVIPRGCAMSFSAFYMSIYAPQEAKTLWETYKQHYFIDLGFCGGFREWPAGQERKADVDSGPIIMNIGLAATGLGILASKALSDEKTYAKLKPGETFILNQSSSDSILSLAIALHASSIKE
ncbi:MAG: hypothetical protein MRY83_18995 [Flavobacteriales bacterium]|nr:hypothetical protein [Flavobacteriales bacterium]